jgi:hypothetical protein
MTAYTFSQLIDFTRTTSATYVNASGLVTTTPTSVNLLLQTQALATTPWESSAQGTAVLPTATNNAGTAPDGTGTATRLQFSLNGGTTTGDIVRRSQSYSTLGSTTYTFSVYLRSFDGSSTYNMHLVGTDGVSTSIVVTGAWQRFTITASRVGTATIFYSIGLRGGLTPANSNTADVLVWGAQLELGSTASAYTKNVGGFFPPRFDYDPVTLAPRGLLVEEQRTNLRTYSQEFDNVGWGKTGATVTANSTTSPDGTVNADSLIEDTATSTHEVLQSGALTAAAHTFSAFVKANGRSWVRLFVFQSGLVGASVWFNVTTGVVGTVGSGATNATITNFGSGWYRCSFTFTALAAAASSYIQIATADNGPSSYTGNGTSGLFIWGAQTEVGAFATSYIPTVASTVTRTADQAVIAAPMFAPWYNQSAGSFLVEVVTFKPTTLAASVIAIDVSDGGINNRDYLGFVSTAAEARTVVGGAVQAVINQNYTANAVEKLAYAVAANDFAFVRNGSLAGTDPSGTIPTVNRMFIGNAAGSAAFLNGHIRSINYYPLRLTNAQLQGLTT